MKTIKNNYNRYNKNLIKNKNIFIKYIDKIPLIISLFTIILLTVSCIRKSCTLNKYGISFIFLDFKIQDIILPLQIIVILILFVSTIPLMQNKIMSISALSGVKKKLFHILCKVIASLIIGTTIGFIMYNTLFSINFSFYNDQSFLICEIISIVGYYFLFRFYDEMFLKRYKRGAKKQGVASVFAIVYLVLITYISGYQMFYGNIPNTCTYDIATIDNTKYAILTTYKDSIIVCNFEKTNQLNDGNGESISYGHKIISKNYKVITSTNIKYSREFLGRIIIDNGKL